MLDRFAPFGPLAPRKNLTAELVDLLTREIVSGKLAPGARLPTEQEMVASFGVSRTVVREAVAALRSEGLVVTRQGAGAFVTVDAQRRPFRIDPDGAKTLCQLLHIMELRMGVEIEAAGLAGQRRTPEQVARIERSLVELDSAIERGETAVEADFDFHRAIAEATGNPYFREFLDFLGHYIIPRQTVRTERSEGAAQKAYLRRVQQEHRRIFEEIAAGNVEGCREAMRVHLEKSICRYRRFAADGKGLRSEDPVAEMGAR
jgi:GntR family transcriptional repressor for pyruvate dehydrogenase complex